MAASNTFSHSPFNAGRDASITTTYNNYGYLPNQPPMVILQDHSALGALHDSAERPDPPKCHPETRQAILDRIEQWVREESEDSKPILWLTGAAGAGKSAIAQTLIEQWQKGKLAVPNFFFWRTSPKRDRKTHLIATIAFQLTKLVPSTKKHIEQAVQDNTIFQYSLKSQIEALIVRPLQVANQSKKHPAKVVIVIDGLDECRTDLSRSGGFPGQGFEEQQREILEAIAFACQRLPTLRFLIASRPERQIRTSFSEAPVKNLAAALSLSDDIDAAADIKLYLVCKFGEIRARYPGIDPSWPSIQQIAQLVEKSSGQFIYPSTVVKYIARRRQYPVKSLEEVLALQSGSNSGKENPLAELDALYTLVLRCVAPESMPIAGTILGLMCYITNNMPNLFRYPRPSHSPLYLEKFLFLCEGEIAVHLTDLHSVLSIPDHRGREDTPIRFAHATLSEYLRDQSRSGIYHISKENVHLECSLLLIKHAKLERQYLQPETFDPPQPPGVRNPYTPQLIRTLAQFTSACPLSKDLMIGLWDFVEDEIGPYSLHGDFELRSHVPTSQTGIASKSYTGLDGLTLWQRKDIFRYLLKCNTEEFEPSESQRLTIETRLKKAISRIDPDDPVLKNVEGNGTVQLLGIIHSVRTWIGW